MQIISYPVHYQSVCTNFDFSLFSRISCICKTYLLHLQGLFVAFAKIYSVRYLLNLRAVLKARDRSHVLPMDDSEGCDAQRDTSL